MAGAIPQPPAAPPPPHSNSTAAGGPPLAATTATAVPAFGAGGAAAASPKQMAATAAATNALRLEAVAKRLALSFESGVPVSPPDLFTLFFALARGIDYALSYNDVPAKAHLLPSIIKQVYHHKNDSSLQSAIMVLMISVKNACKHGWFEAADANELLSMADELCSSFCMPVSVTTDAGHALDTISKIMLRFYPSLRFCRLVASFEAKPGYDILMVDFQIQRNIPPDEKIMLIVAQTDDLETSSCLITPPQVSFLINGKGVERRSNVSMDNGPQFPTDIARMLKYGTNIIQAIGYFGGNYIIAIAFLSKITSHDPPILKDYVPPAVAEPVSDSEIIEGPSRISLNCPISFKRIKTPVKGHLCKHHQCFDYENFMDMNSRKPSWRCPCCNTPACSTDLCIDQNMVKILGEVGEDVADVVIYANGSWKVVSEHNGNTNQCCNGKHSGQIDGNVESDTNTFAEVLDLTMEEDVETDATGSSTKVDSLPGPANVSQDSLCENEDRKPFKDCHSFPVSEFLAVPPIPSIPMTTQAAAMRDGIWPRNLLSTSNSNGLLAMTSGPNIRALGTLESLVPNDVLNPVITDAVSPSLNLGSAANLELSQTTFSFQHASQSRQLAENMQLQQSQFGGSLINNETRRPSIPRNASRTPIAVQALPALAQTPTSSRRMHASALNSTSVISDGPASLSYQAIHSLTATPDGFGMSADMEIEQMSRTPDVASSSLPFLSATQNEDHQGHQYAANPVVQMVVGHSAVARPPPDQQRGAGAYRSPMQLNHRIHHSSSQLANIQMSSRALPVQAQQPSHNPAGAVGSLANSRNLLYSAQRATQLSRLQAGGAAVQPQTTRGALSSPAAVDRGWALPSPRSDGFPELPSEQNWRPTGRMRGSLTGSAYSAALNQYLVPRTKSMPVRPPPPPPPVSVTTSTSDRLQTLIANNINAHGPMKQQTNLRHGDAGSQPGGASI